MDGKVSLQQQGREDYHPHMRLFIGHESALHFWQSAWSDSLDLDAQSPVRSLRYAANSAQDVQEFPLEKAGFRDGQIDILVPEANLRCTSLIHKAHVWSGPLAPGSFFEVRPGVYVASPEFAFLQMASILDLPHLVKLGDELCSSYRGDDYDVRGFMQVKPRTSVASLARYIDKMAGCKGAKAARYALRFVVGNAASPMETALVMLLCLPKRYGGYGLPLPEMNGVIDLNERAADMVGKRYFRCDLLWARFRVAIEYDSDMFHTGKEKIANDSVRRNVLGFMGINVITVTRSQLYSASGMQSIAEQLAKAMRKREIADLRVNAATAALRDWLLHE